MNSEQQAIFAAVVFVLVATVVLPAGITYLRLRGQWRRYNEEQEYIKERRAGWPEEPDSRDSDATDDSAEEGSDDE